MAGFPKPQDVLFVAGKIPPFSTLKPHFHHPEPACCYGGQGHLLQPPHLQQRLDGEANQMLIVMGWN